MTEKLQKWMKLRGYQVAVADKDMLNDIKKQIGGLNLSSKIDPTLFDREFRLMYQNLEELDTGSSVILVAVSRPVHRLRFQTEHDMVETIIPPTYMNYRNVKAEVLTDLMEFLGANRDEFHPFDGFLKTLAVYLGISSYGRNNISYTEFFGSYYQLIGIHTKIEIAPIFHPPLTHRRLLDPCKKCHACQAICPTQSIRREPFIMNANNCLTNLNESPGSLDNMSKFTPKFQCIVGCLDCQEICPANKGKLHWKDAPVEFTPIETDAILSDYNTPGGESWRKKMDILGMSQYTEVLGRNLRCIMNRYL